MQRLLVSVRGINEAIAAIQGGAHIADIEYPASALGTPYPLNISAVRNKLDKTGYKKIPISTNIGEKQLDRASACQAALGVATAGADIIKCGLAELPLEAAIYQGDTIVRTVRRFYPKKKIVPAVFADDEMCRFLNPLTEGPQLVKKIGADGLLLDTFNKHIGKGLLDYYDASTIKKLVSVCHKNGIECWIAGSISIDELSELWATNVDVICVRSAASEQTGRGRFGEVKSRVVTELVSTLPKPKASKK